MTNEEKKRILQRGFDHLASLVNAVKRIKDESPDDYEQKTAGLSMVYRTVNDILHPLYEEAYEYFPDQNISGWINSLQESHKETIQRKIFPPCGCTFCNSCDGVTEMLMEKYDPVLRNLADESSSRDPNKTEQV